MTLAPIDWWIDCVVTPVGGPVMAVIVVFGVLRMQGSPHVREFRNAFWDAIAPAGVLYFSFTTLLQANYRLRLTGLDQVMEVGVGVPLQLSSAVSIASYGSLLAFATMVSFRGDGRRAMPSVFALCVAVAASLLASRVEVASTLPGLDAAVSVDGQKFTDFQD
jgi:hypothetical protein